MNSREITVRIDSGSIVKGLLFVLLFLFLYLVRDVVLIVLTAVVLASAIEPVARWLVRRGVPRIIGVIWIYLVVAALIAVIVYFFLPPLLSDIADVIANAPEYITALNLQEESGLLGEGIFGSITSQFTNPEVIAQFRDFLGRVSGGAFSLLSSIFGGVLSFFLIIVMSFYMAVQKDGIAHFLRAVTPYRFETYILDLWGRSQRKIGRWLQGQITLSLLVGLLTFLGLTVVGIPNAFFLALIAAGFELIPIFGPILASIPAILIALVNGGLSLALATVILYVIIQQIEGQILHPLVIEKVVGVPALLVIISLLIGAKLAGFLGVLLSVPAAATLMEYVADIENRKRTLHRQKEESVTI